MARAGLLLGGLLFITACAASGDGPAASGNAEIRRKLGELERLLRGQQRLLESQRGQLEGQQEQIRALEAGARRLVAGVKPSIFGSVNGTRPYTDAESLAGALTHTWLLLCGALVVLMQAGFALVEAGSCRVKNVQSVLLRHLLDACVGGMVWWLFGWSFAFSGRGEDGQGKASFMGSEQFAGHGFLEVLSDGQQEPSRNMLDWFFQWALCSVVISIAGSGISERVNLGPYVVYSVLMTGFIYPVVAAWTRGLGWLSDMNDTGYVDFAGGGIVHLTGGIGALVAAVVAGPRAGRFEDELARARALTIPDRFAPHNVPFIVLGTFILWFGWYGLNCGSTMSMSSIEKGFLAAHIAMNTTISAAASGLTVFVLRLALLRRHDITGLCNGILAGLVSISAACANVECGSACAIGAIGALVFQASSMVVRLLKIDDPVDAFAVHGAAGAWAVVAAAIFDFGNDFGNYHGQNGFKCTGWEAGVGGCKGSLAGQAFMANVVGIGAVALWVGGLTLVILLPIRCVGVLRAPSDTHECGFDESRHIPQRAYVILGTASQSFRLKDRGQSLHCI